MPDFDDPTYPFDVPDAYGNPCQRPHKDGIPDWPNKMGRQLHKMSKAKHLIMKIPRRSPRRKSNVKWY